MTEEEIYFFKAPICFGLFYSPVECVIQIPTNPFPDTPATLGLSCQAKPLYTVSLGPSPHLHSWGVSLAAPTEAEVFTDFPTSLGDLVRRPGPTGGLASVQAGVQAGVLGGVDEKLVLQTVYQVLQVVLMYSNNSLSSKCIFYDGHFLLRVIFMHSQQVSHEISWFYHSF
jgi:hypothetical protein